MNQDEVRVEGFAESLKSRRIFCTGSPNQLPALVRSRIAVLDGEVAHRGRKVLFLSPAAAAQPWLSRMKWDAIFVLHDTQDLRLGLTYVANTVKPVRLVWAAAEPVPAVWATLQRMEGLSLLGFGPAAPTTADWDAIFWTQDSGYDAIEPALTARMGSGANVSYTLRSVLKETAASDVGLVWSSIGETDRRGSLYWYDPSEGAGVAAPLYSASEAAELLRSIADSFAQGGGSKP